MTQVFQLLLFVSLLVGYAAPGDQTRGGRQIFQQLTTYAARDSGNYQMCKVDTTVGACLSQQDCARERGLFAGYCGATDAYCCVVDKTCGGRTSAHHAYFRNPSFPKNDSEARTCNFEVEIGKKVCAVRLAMEKFELARYDEGVCIRDTLTVLGSSLNETSTPFCGNMTGWTTTFHVKEKNWLILAMVVQGVPEYTFSIRVTQIACKDIDPFISPTWAGIRNADAIKYKPTTTTTTKKPTTTTDSTAETPTTEDTTQTTEMLEETTTVMNDPVVRVVTTTPEPEEPLPTTLKPGTLTTPSSVGVLIRAPPEAVSEEGVYLESVDTTSAISAFRRVFELKVDDRCWKYDDDSIDSSFRIIGGVYTNINEYPWQVALVYKSKFFCGGSIISDRHILTAAHCVFGSFSRGIHEVRVSLGDHDLSTRNETKNKVSRIRAIHWHLHYNPHSTVNDIAILELEWPIDFSYGISAVKIPSDLEDRFEEANATVTGWGRYATTVKKTSSVMKEYTAPLMNTTACVLAWEKFPGVSAKYDKHVCLTVKRGTPCHGDSGGPLVTCSGVQCTQIGVVSFGFPLCTNVGLPAVFTRITFYKPWMDINLHQLHYF
ncbi:transmembrane protease serine 11D isoform X1 [Procambarus clarkii]|uniref:transmembrane protease serine 11D isoform X1 n=1 Tax=Procambarus clarkii TaxID=6728 RepID=UPI003742372A